MSSEILSALIGLFMPFLVELVKVKINRSNLRWANYTIAVVVSLVVGFVSTFVKGVFDLQNWMSSTGLAFIAAQAVYNLWWKPAKMDERTAKWLK